MDWDRIGDASVMLEILGRHREPFVVLDDRGEVRFANERARQLFGGKDAIGRPLTSYLDADSGDALRLLFEDWRAEPASVEGRALVTLFKVERGVEPPRIRWVPVPVREDAPDGGLLALFGYDVAREHSYQTALGESELRQRSILRGVLTPLVIIDAFGIIQSVSDSVLPAFGYAPEELVGQNVKILMSEPYRSEHDRYLATYRVTGATNILGRSRVFEVVRKDGRVIRCELSVSRIDIPGRAEPLFTGSLRDITSKLRSREALRESERRMRAIFDQEFQHVALLDAEGKLLDVNNAALELNGFRRQDVVGKPLWETGWWNESERSRARIREWIERARGGEFVRAETTFRAGDGRTRDLDFSVKAVHGEDDEVEFLICEARDITEMRRAQESQHSMLSALAEIGQSAAMLAHEIKTPVTAVHMAMAAVADRLGDEDRRVLDDLVVRMKRLQLMMRQTLSFAKALDPARQDCHSIALLDDAIEAAQLCIEDAGADVAVDDSCEVLTFRGDRALLGEVLVNLIENAVTMAPKGGRVRLAARREGEAGVRISVWDDGPGIPEDVRETLFKPFVTTRASGTGLGLPICKRIIEAHRGRIDVANSPLGGAGFEIILPLDA